MPNWRSSGNREPGDHRRFLLSSDGRGWGVARDELIPNLMPSASSFYEVSRRRRHGIKAVSNTCVSLKVPQDARSRRRAWPTDYPKRRRHATRWREPPTSLIL
jgi:hypothetical protein